MTIIHGDCLEVMAGMEPESVDAIVTDPPYGLEFMGKEWDSPSKMVGQASWGGREHGAVATRKGVAHPRGIADVNWPLMQQWHEAWAREALRVAKPSAYLLAFGGTRTVHRMTVALEDAGWIIRDMLVWAYASGFPKSKASLKPAWEPIVMARKPGPLRMLAIDECRIPTDDPLSLHGRSATDNGWDPRWSNAQTPGQTDGQALGRWPANVILTDPIFDGGVEGVVGGGEVKAGVAVRAKGGAGAVHGIYGAGMGAYPEGSPDITYGDSGTYSRFFLVPKSARSDREPVVGIGGEAESGGRVNVHPTPPSSPPTSCATSSAS